MNADWSDRFKKTNICPKCGSGLGINIYGEIKCFSCGWIDEDTLAPEHIKKRYIAWKPSE